MTERTPISPFEARLARRLVGYANVPIRQLDAHIAAALDPALGRQPSPIRLRWLTSSTFRWAGVIAVALALSAVGALVAGMLLHQDGPRLGRLVYAEAGGGLFIADANGQNAHMVRDGFFQRPTWSPDGRFIAVLQEPQQLDILRPDGGLVEEIAGAVGSYEWAPGGPTARLAAVVDSALVVKDIDLGATVPITVNPEFVSSWAWTSDRTIVWMWTPEMIAMHVVQLDRRAQDLTAMQLPDRAIEVPVTPTYREYQHPLISPDGTHLATAARIELFFGSDLGIIPVAGGPIRVVGPQLHAYAACAWTLDSLAVIAEVVAPTDVSEHRTLDVIPIDGSAPRALFTQAADEAWLLVDDSPVDLARDSVLVGKQTALRDTQSGSLPVMDLFLVDPGAAPRRIATGVIGADVFWSTGGA